MARLRGIGGTLVLDADGLGKLAARDRGACKRFEAAHKHRSKIVTAASTLPEVLRGGTKDAAVQQAPEHALDALEPEIYEAERPLRKALLHELLDELAAEF